MAQASPLILTLTLDKNSFSFFNALRTKYFPPAVNYLSAHLTLFHHLPLNEQKIKDDLQQWSKTREPLLLTVANVVSIGKGVAYKMESAELLQLHKMMQEAWQEWLTPQDRQKLWPHLTVQNKVPPTVAKETLNVLRQNFQPFTAKGLGFALWVYEGGPWRHAADYRFA